VTHLQLPLEMCHTAKFKTLSVRMAQRRQLAIPMLTRQSCHRKGSGNCGALPWVSWPTVTSTIPSLGSPVRPKPPA